jgi:hypothetical protein
MRISRRSWSSSRAVVSFLPAMRASTRSPKSTMSLPYLITSAMRLMRSPAARRARRSLEPPRGVHRTTPSTRQPPGHGRCHRQRSLARSNLGKARIDPRESRAHSGMNVFEHRARSHLFFGLGENVSRSVCLDGPTREFTRGDALASAHLAKLLHALARYQVLLAHQIFGFCRHTKLLRVESHEPQGNYTGNPTHTQQHTQHKESAKYHWISPSSFMTTLSVA